MSAPNSRSIIRVPGRLCVSPTDLTTAFPHGGTAIGNVRDVTFERRVKSIPIHDESMGTHRRNLYVGESPRLILFLRGFDSDAISSFLPNALAGTKTGENMPEFVPTDTTKNLAGYWLDDQAVKVYFSPDSKFHKPGILLYNASPSVEESDRVQFENSKNLETALVLLALPDTSGRTYRVGKAADLNAVLT